MLLTLRVTGEHAADLEVLLDKCPDKLHSTRLPFGSAHVFFPEVSPEAMTAALLVDIDAVGLSAGGSAGRFAMANAATLSLAIAQIFSTALAARSPLRPDLVTSVLPMETRVSSLAVARDSDDARALFAPLGYDVSIEQTRPDETSNAPKNLVHHAVCLAKQCPLYEVLSHIYVLAPLIDGHAADPLLETQREDLIMHAEGIVRGHPLGDSIMQAYTARRPSSVGAAFDRLLATDLVPGQTSRDTTNLPTLLDEARIETIVLELRELGAHSVLDLGCGDGKLLARLVREKALTRIIGLDVSHREIEAAASRLKLDRRTGKKSERMELLHGSLYYSDSRLSGFDTAVLVDVIQHVPAERLADVERVVFQEAHPTHIIVMMNEPRGEGSILTNSDQCWSTNRFDAWATWASERHGYRVRLLSPSSSAQTTRMAVFSR